MIEGMIPEIPLEFYLIIEKVACATNQLSQRGLNLPMPGYSGIRLVSVMITRMLRRTSGEILHLAHG